MLEQRLTKTLLIWYPSAHTLSYIPIPLLIENIDIHRAPSHKLLALNFHCIDLAHQYEWGLLCVCSSPSVRRFAAERAFPRTHPALKRIHAGLLTYRRSPAWQTATARLTSPLFTQRCALCPSTPLSIPSFSPPSVNTSLPYSYLLPYRRLLPQITAAERLKGQRETLKEERNRKW